jgi:hypothetical protein
MGEKTLVILVMVGLVWSCALGNRLIGRMIQMKKMLLILMVLASVAMAGDAHAQIGWMLDQCRKHWGRETSIEHWRVDESQTITEPAYIFGSDSKLEKEVTLDPQGKVKEVYYIGPSKGPGFLKIAQLLAKEEGVNWAPDLDYEENRVFDPAGPTPGELGYRHGYWIGYKNDVAVFQARYYFGKRDVDAKTWGESLHITTIAP